MDELTVFDLFSGIGGFSLGLESVGFRTIAFAEIDPDASTILRGHWPGVPNLGDIKGINGADFIRAHGKPMVITGGVPCQPASLLGERRGTSDERWLWPEFLRLVREIRPRYVIAENPPAILILESGRAYNGIVSELVKIGYDCQWDVFPAAAFGAGHLRERLFLIGSNADSERFDWKRLLLRREQKEVVEASGFCEEVSSADSNGAGLEGHSRNGNAIRRPNARRPIAAPDLRSIKIDHEDWWKTQSPVQPVVDGLPSKLAQSALRCVGNSVLPQIPAFIGKAIISTYEKST